MLNSNTAIKIWILSFGDKFDNFDLLSAADMCMKTEEG